MHVLPYLIAAYVFVIGCYGLATSRNLIHAVGCLAVCQCATYILLLAVGYRDGATAPVFSDIQPGSRPVVDPVVQALTLTDIVVGATVTALLLALVVQISKRALYVLGHAGVKAALFACAGILLDRYGTVDEFHLHGRARRLRGVGVMFALGALALAGLPPFGTGLGKAVSEEAVGGPLTVLHVAVSAVTGAAVLRVTARVFYGLGPRPEEREGEERDEDKTSGSDEEPETRRRLTRVPDTMRAVAALLLAGALAAGAAPGFAGVVARSVDEAGSWGVFSSVHWTAAGVLLDLLSTALAVGLAALAVVRPRRPAAPDRALPLRRLQSGHVGDYVAWTLLGMTLLGTLVAVGGQAP
ncbi:NADH-quinone oxidoreductase subunit K [Streptomyces anandii]|uniref:NADH-quinone oxidoreductase subunit K n=1 Tax=Streptomyces anandii TaxID=285454 RepID=UPI0036D175DD